MFSAAGRMSDDNSERSTLPIEYSEGWKYLQNPVGQAFRPPLYINHPPPPKRRRRAEEKEEEEIGPTIFAPCPETLTQLYSSHSITPRLPLPYPRLSLPRYLKTSDPSLLSSDVRAIASEFGPQQATDFTGNLHGFNSLKLLSCESGGSSFDLAFFPTDDNCDKVGCLKICAVDSRTNSDNVRVFTANQRLYSRILKLLVSPASDFIRDCTESVDIYGYVMACTMYSVNWYLVRSASDGFGGKGVAIVSIGDCLFEVDVVNACWSPHLNEESVVLLENGELYLFDITSCVEKKSGSSNKVVRKKLQVRWDGADLKDAGWVAVEFAWHSRTIIVANASAVFLVDFRFGEYKVSCLLKIEMLNSVRNDRFLALCQAGSGFNFCVSSRHLLLLCDVRVPYVPVLKWVHGLPNPCYATVFRLSELRSNAKDDRFKWATDSGSCILLGSFWNCEFSLFVYGPKSSSWSVCPELSNIDSSYYAWGNDYRFSLSDNSSHCSDCFVRTEFSKTALPVWVDWRQKTEFVMGFGILTRDTQRQFPETDNFGGFSLIRLMSSGKVEAMRYEAVWEFDQNCDKAHPKTLCGSQADCLYDLEEEKYHPPKNTVYSFMKFKFLGEYLKVKLDRIVAEEMNSSQLVSSLEAISDEIAEESDSGELPRFESVSRIVEALKDLNLLTSVHEISLRSILTGMPQYLAHLALSGDEDLDCKKACLPPHFLLTLHRLYVERETGTRRLERSSVLRSADDEIRLQCNRVMEAASELTGSNSETDSQSAVSLADDDVDLGTKNEDVRKFSIHEPAVLFDHFRAEDHRFTKFVFPKQEVNFKVDPAMDGLELLDVGSPVMLKFSDRAVFFGPNVLKIFQTLKKHDLKMQKGFRPYQDYLSRTGLRDRKM